MNILIAILALSFLIIVHELGHFAVAKLTGIKVHEFSLFMGPKLFSFQKGETVYSVRAVPLGGFVKMEGEEQESTDARAFNRKPLHVRAAVIAAGPIMNILVAVLILSIALSFTGYNTTTVEQVVPDSPAYKIGIQKGDVITGYSQKKIYHPMDMFLFLFGTKGKPAQIDWMRDNQTYSDTITPEIIAENRYILGFSTESEYGADSNVVKTVDAGYPSFEAGLQPGDVIVRLNDREVASKKEIRNYLSENKDKPLTVWVRRNGEEKPLKKVVPVMQKAPEQYDMGIAFESRRGDFADIVKNSVVYSYSIARNVYYSLSWLLTGKISLTQMSGPVGIVNTIGDVVEKSPTMLFKIVNLFYLIALISINLGLFNLIPFPALDGSKLLLIVVEGVRRKAIPPEKEAFISMVGFVLLIMLMIFTTYNDILRIFGGG